MRLLLALVALTLSLSSYSQTTKVEVDFSQVSSNVEQVVFTNEATGQHYVFNNRPGRNIRNLPDNSTYSISVVETPSNCPTYSYTPSDGILRQLSNYVQTNQTLVPMYVITYLCE